METQTKPLVNLVENILEDLQAIDVTSIDVNKLTSITDTIVICTGRSKRHVYAIADNLIHTIKQEIPKPRAQGLENSEWVIVDMHEVVLHVMLPEVREFYQLEKLWDKDLIITNKENASN